MTDSSGHPIFFSLIQGTQLKLLLGRTRSDRPCSLTDASMPEHEALPSSHKMCLQIEAVISFCSGEHQEPTQRRSAKLKKSAGKLENIICQTALFDWIIILVRLKVMKSVLLDMMNIVKK